MSRSSSLSKDRHPLPPDDVDADTSTESDASSPNKPATGKPLKRPDSSDSSHGSAEVYLTPRHKLYEVKRPKEKATADEPPVIWTANVFQMRQDIDPLSEYPTAIYCDDKPLDISLGEGGEDLLLAEPTSRISKALPANSERPAWTGCIFEVSCQALADFPVSAGNRMKDTIRERGNERANWRIQPILTSEPQSRPLTSRFEALIFNRVSRSNIIINSPYLVDVIKNIAGYYPSFWAKSSDPETTHPRRISTNGIKIADPLGILFHRLPEMEAFLQSQPNRTKEDMASLSNEELKLHLQREHVSHLFQFLKPFYDSRVLPCRKILEETAPQLSFEMLWYVFAPGTDVYRYSAGSSYACVIHSIRSNLDKRKTKHSKGAPFEREYWRLKLWYLDSDGRKVGRVTDHCTIYSYPGLRQLTSLDVCPAAIWDASDNGELRERCMKRSRLRAKSLQEGHLLAWHDGPTSDGTRYVSEKTVPLIGTDFT